MQWSAIYTLGILKNYIVHVAVELFALAWIYLADFLPWVTSTPRAVTVQLLPQASYITVWKVSVFVRLFEGDTY